MRYPWAEIVRCMQRHREMPAPVPELDARGRSSMGQRPQPRQHPIRVLVNEQELQELKDAAGYEPLASWIRRMVLERAREANHG